MRYLAIDPGQKRSGLAVGDDATQIVTPIGVVTAGSDEQRLRLLIEAIDAQQPDALVVGLPLNMDDSEGPAAAGARALAERLTQATGLIAHLFDERLSSFAADEQMGGAGLTRDQKKARRDALAAAAILRGFLESHGPGAPDGKS